MRRALILGMLGLAGCLPADPQPSAGARAQAERLEGAPMLGKGAGMRFPWPLGGTVHDVAVAQDVTENQDIAIGLRYGAVPDGATAAKVAGQACRAIGRQPRPVPGLRREGDWLFAGGCA